MLRILAIIFAFIGPVAWANSGFSPIGVALVPPVQFPPSDYNVGGVRISVVGNMSSVYGIDLGLIGNITKEKFSGIALSGIFNLTEGSTTVVGAQIAGLFNLNTKSANVFGIQAALMNFNSQQATVTGFQVGAVNESQYTDINGIQLGLYNHALHVRGFQVGVINRTKNLHGLQVGLVNIYEMGALPYTPILNIGFQ